MLCFCPDSGRLVIIFPAALEPERERDYAVITLLGKTTWDDSQPEEWQRWCWTGAVHLFSNNVTKTLLFLIYCAGVYILLLIMFILKHTNYDCKGTEVHSVFNLVIIMSEDQY